MSEPFRLKEIAVPAIFILALFLMVLILPQLGILMSILSPVPLVIVYLQRGKEVGLVGVGVVVFVLLLLMGPRQAIFFTAEYGVLALVLGESIRHYLPLDRTIFFSALATAVASCVLLFLAFAGNEVSPGEFLQQQVKDHLLQSLETLKDLNTQNSELETLDEGTIGSLSKKLAWSYPAFLFSGSLFVALINYSVIRLLWRRLLGNSGYFIDSFSRWVLPEFFIWVLISSAATVWFVQESFVFAVGLNALILAVVVYCLQGIAVAIFFLEAKSIPVFLWVVLFVFIFAQPILIGILIGMGVFDLWVDFRKLKPKPVVPDSGDEE